MIVDKVTDLIGNTPMLRLRFKNNGWELYLKLEQYNPGRSIKDRMAFNMINDLEKRGKLKKGGTIIESSSGNTATGLAFVSAVRGYKFMAVMDHHSSQEKKNRVRAYGAEVVLVDSSGKKENEVAIGAREKLAQKLHEEIGGSVFVKQADNPANRDAYVDTLAKELYDEVPDLDMLFAAIGTTGSICGTAMGLKKRGIASKIIAIEPVGSMYFSKKGKGYYQSGTGMPVEVGREPPHIYDKSLIDEGLQASDAEAFNTCLFMARRFGLLIGGSSGGVLFKAVEKLSKRTDGGKAVALIYDGGEKYLDTIFNNGWMERHNFNDSKITEFLSKTIVCPNEN